MGKQEYRIKNIESIEKHEKNKDYQYFQSPDIIKMIMLVYFFLGSFVVYKKNKYSPVLPQ